MPALPDQGSHSSLVVQDTLPNLERQLSHADDMFQEASIKGTHLAKAFRADIGDDIIAQLLSNPEALEAIKRKHNPRIQECDQQKQQWLKLREQASCLIALCMLEPRIAFVRY